MKDDDFDRLVNDELDGVATPEEKARLSRQLAASEAARVRYQEIQAVFGMLDRVESVEPPGSLRTDVLREVEARARARSPRWGWGVLVSGFGRRPAFRIGYAFAAGAVVGALVIALGTGVFERRSWSDADVVGTMLPPASSPTGRPLDDLQLSVKGARVVGQTWVSRSGGVGVGLESRSAGEIQARLLFDPDRYVPVSVQRTEPGGGRLELRRGELEFTHRGDGQCEVILMPTGPDRPPLRLEIRTPEGAADGVLRASRPG